MPPPSLTRLLHRLTALEQRCRPQPLDRHQQETLDFAAAVCGPEVADAIRQDIIAGAYWLHSGILVGCLQAGCPPAEIQREFQYYRNIHGRQLSRTLAAFAVWLQTPAGQARYINPLYAFRHQNDTDRQVQTALGKAWCLAQDSTAVYWTQSSAEAQQQVWLVALLCLAYGRCPDPDVFALPDRREADVLVAETGLAVHREWLRWACDNSPGAQGAYRYLTGQEMPVPPAPEETWADELRLALRLAEGETWEGF